MSLALPPARLSQIEALLFVSGEPLALKKIETLLKLTAQELERALTALRERHSTDPASGLMLIEHRGAVELATKKDHLHLIETFTKSFLQESLSKPALEVLAIIAYRAPIARSSIEAIRGVNCSFTLRNLLLRGLIEREENPEDTREYVYSPSFALLEKLGLGSREELPDYALLSSDERLQAFLSPPSATLSSHSETI